MATTMYLYQDSATGLLDFGSMEFVNLNPVLKKGNRTGSGKYRRYWDTDGVGVVRVGLKNIENGDFGFPLTPVSLISKDVIGTPYASLAEIDIVMTPFLLSSGGSGSGGGNGTQTLWAALAAGVEGQTAFTLRIDTDTAADKSAFAVSRDGVTFLSDNTLYNISLVGGTTPTITFTVPFSAEEVGNKPYVGYPTKTTDLIVKVRDEVGNPTYPSGKPARVQARLTRPADTIAYAALDAINSSVGTPVSLNLPNMAINNGGGGCINQVNVTTNNLAFAGQTITAWVYNDEPTGVVGDNVNMVMADTNTSKGRFYFDVTFGQQTQGIRF
jgi:hypothetical protein